MSYYYLRTSDDHLEHHGILGMRWGIRRFQPYPKGSRGGKEIGEAAKKARGGSLRERRAKKKMIKAQAEILTRARAAKSEKEARARILEEVKKRPTATTVLEFVDELSNEDLNNLNNRIKAIRTLEATAKEERDAGFNYMDDAMNKVKKVKDWGKTGVDSYNTINDILSILNGTYKKKGDKKGDKKDKDNE